MTDNKFKLLNGNKFAFLLISGGHMDPNLPDSYQLKPGLWVMKKFPIDLDKTWQGWLGANMIKEIQKASLCIASKCESISPESIDKENERLKKQLRSLLLGIILSGFCQFSSDHFILTGSIIEDNASVRSINKENRSIWQAGAPFESITIESLYKSLKIAEAADKIETLRSGGDFKRIFRALHAYHSALHEVDLGERLHQFVRSIEGFVFPKQGKARKQFISRTELFLGNNFHDFSGELYDLRSVIEHLHGPYFLEGENPNKEYRLKIWQQILQSEAFARYCMSYFLLNESIWPYFKNDRKIELFWGLSDKIKKEIWDSRFDLKQISAGFRMHVVDKASLLL
jgi:hypothetical protein